MPDRLTIAERGAVITKELATVEDSKTKMTCPNCGGEPTIYKDIDFISKEADSYFLVCEKCKVWIDLSDA